MVQNSKKLGLRFEQDFFKSIPAYCLSEKFKDSPSTFKHVDNASDFWIFNGQFLMLVECKSTNQISFPLRNIRNKQLLKMSKYCCKNNVFGGYLIEYRSLEKVYFIPVETFINWYISRDRESIPYTWVSEHGILIQGFKKRTRFTWDVQMLLDWVTSNCYIGGDTNAGQ